MKEGYNESTYSTSGTGTWIGRGHISVECYAGYRGEETPRRFKLGRRQVEILDVKDRWLAPDHRYFKVQAADGGEYILRHDSQTDLWEITAYEQTEPDIPSTD
jgi:hypothetical protein